MAGLQVLQVFVGSEPDRFRLYKFFFDVDRRRISAARHLRDWNASWNRSNEAATVEFFNQNSSVFLHWIDPVLNRNVGSINKLKVINNSVPPTAEAILKKTFLLTFFTTWQNFFHKIDFLCNMFESWLVRMALRKSPERLPPIDNAIKIQCSVITKLSLQSYFTESFSYTYQRYDMCFFCIDICPNFWIKGRILRWYFPENDVFRSFM